MFPIPSERKLSVVEIAKHWSREIDPPALAQELRDVISKAWWRGELIAANGASRLSVLRGYYLRSAKFIAFAIPNTEEPPQWVADDDGVIEFVRPLWVPVPNANPDTWTEANCAPAFDSIAEQWNEAVISPSAPVFLDIDLTSGEFFRWVDTCRCTSPKFWSSEEKQQSDQGTATDDTIPPIKITKVPPESAKSRAAWEALIALWPNGPPANFKTADIHRKVNKWIEKAPRAKYPFKEVSRDTVARLLGRK
jgi:hypothetical protein